MSRLGRIQHTLEQSVDHPRMASMLAGVDQFASILSHANYQGSNPAIASAYAPMRAGLIAITAIILITLIFGVLIPLESAAIAQAASVLNKIAREHVYSPFDCFHPMIVKVLFLL